MNFDEKLPTLLLLSGGLATRLHPLTISVPKAMINIAGKPFIHHQFELLHKNGVRDVVLCVGNLSQQIIDYIGDGQNFGINVKYSDEGNDLLGTGGAIKKAADLLGEKFFVMYGDSYLDIDLNMVFNAHKSHEKSGLMVVLKNQNQLEKSNVEFLNGNVISYNKLNPTSEMQHIDYGISVFRKNEFLQAAGDLIRFDLSIIHQKMILNNDLAGYEVFHRFYEIGSLSGINELNNLLTRLCSPIK